MSMEYIEFLLIIIMILPLILIAIVHRKHKSKRRVAVQKPPQPKKRERYKFTHCISEADLKRDEEAEKAWFDDLSRKDPAAAKKAQKDLDDYRRGAGKRAIERLKND